jgi:hypothetical protein
MGVHGGHMQRSLSRFMGLAGAIAVGSLLAGCAAAVPGPAVIVAPPAAAAAAASPSGDFLAGLEQAVANELSAINSTQTDNEPPSVLIELNALSSESSLLQAETFGKLQTMGANQVAKRERLVSALTADVRGSTYLNGVSVNGTSLSGSILAMLGRVDGQLQSEASSVQSTTLIDELRTLIINLGPSTRVFGLVLPAVHLAIAGGVELNGVNLLEGQYQTLLRKANLHKKSPDYAEESARLRDLAANIATVKSTVTSDLEAVLALSPAGYPGNKATILSARAHMTQFRSPLGQLNTGAGDVNEIEFLLSERAA